MFCARSAKRLRPLLGFASEVMLVVSVSFEFVSCVVKFSSERWIGDDIFASSPPLKALKAFFNYNNSKLVIKDINLFATTCI